MRVAVASPLFLRSCLAHLVTPTDTTKPDTKTRVKWWEPQPSGKYDGDWRVWRGARRQQEESDIQRCDVAMVNVQFTRQQPLANGCRRLSQATKRRLQSDPAFKYAEYSEN